MRAKLWCGYRPWSGSGVLATKAFQDQDWVQALGTFPVAAVSAAWAAYSGAFVAALEEEIGKLGDKNAREVVQWPGAIARTLQWQFSRFERKYRQKQLLKCLYNDVEGYDAGGTVPLLEDVFVPLELSGDLASGPDGRVLPLQLGSRFGFWRQKLSELKTLDIWDFLSQVRKGQEYRQLVILAWGGFGKTTLLRHITAVYAGSGGGRRRTPKLVPFFIRLRKWGTILAAQDAPRLAEFLRERHIAEGLELGPPPLAWVQHLLETGQALVLLDGFDEVPAEQREAVSLWIGRELEACLPGGFYPQFSARRL